MYMNIGKTIQTFSTVLLVIGIIFAITGVITLIGGMFFCITGSFTGVIVMSIAIALSVVGIGILISSMFVSGYGKLVENSSIIVDLLIKEKEIKPNPAPSIPTDDFESL